MFQLTTINALRSAVMPGVSSQRPVDQVTTRMGVCLQLRELQARDADAFRRFVDGLSHASRRMRFHVSTPVGDAQVGLVCGAGRPGGPTAQTWVWSLAHDPDQMVGEVCVAFSPAPDDAAVQTVELGIVVADDHQRQGVGLRSVKFVQGLARRRGVTAVKGTLLSHNRAVVGLLEQCQFELARDVNDPGLVHAVWRRSEAWFDDEATPSAWQRLISRMAGL